jgi:hypothetical protein
MPDHFHECCDSDVLVDSRGSSTENAAMPLHFFDGAMCSGYPYILLTFCCYQHVLEVLGAQSVHGPWFIGLHNINTAVMVVGGSMAYPWMQVVKNLGQQLQQPNYAT